MMVVTCHMVHHAGGAVVANTPGTRKPPPEKAPADSDNPDGREVGQMLARGA